MPDKNTIAKIKTALLKAIEKNIAGWSEELEIKYPDWKGSRVLKKSGNPQERRIIFGYDNKEANELEVGTPAKSVTGSYTQRVSPHQRNLGKQKKNFVTALTKKVPKRKKVNVKSHKRVYTGYTPIQLASGEWRMMDKIPAQKAKKLISKSVKKRFTEKVLEKSIIDAIKNEFK